MTDSYVGKEIAGQFRIVKRIGSGGMGAVYEAVHQSLPRRFAIKVLHSVYARRDAFTERFRREAIATSRVPRIAASIRP